MPPLAEAALALAGRCDLAAQAGVTAAPGRGRAGRRVDRVFVNAVAAGRVASARLRWDLGTPTHAALAVGVAPPPSHLARPRPALPIGAGAW